MKEKSTIYQLVSAIRELGWTIYLPDLEGDDTVPGLIIGTEEYIESIIKHLPDDATEKRIK